ncbi:aminotransferase class III-fold pyridoxal phosphate-dependent enzyme, partial [bacterium]|nr:aminotransferase class III-fold pyridoxal phosphate-dependent enzyme [bacterium]
NRNGAFEIITMENAFHGRTLATMSASGKPQWESLFEPKVAGFVKVPFNNLEAVEQVISDRTVAIMLEPVQGEGGVVPASDAFLAGIRQLADRHGLLMIVDEVQTGIGRTGTLFGYQHADIEPDIMTLGKGLGGGVPLAALVSKRSASVFEHGDQGGTYNGNPLMTAVGNAVFQTVSHPEFLLNVRDVGDYLMTQLNRLSDRYRLKGVRGRGLLQALILDSERASEIVKSAFEKGLLINAPRPDVIRFMPSLRVTHSEIDQGISILESLL